jgi:plastocyanin
MNKILAAAAVALLCTAPAMAQEWGNLKMKFVVDGKAPAPPKLDITKDQAYCGMHNLVNERLTVGKGGELANVVVYLSAKPTKIHPDYEAALKKEVKIDNSKCRFEPHVSFIRTGQKLIIGNSDPIGHNTKADFFENTPFNDLIPSKGSITKTFNKAEKTPSGISCSIHPWMAGHLLILDHPYAAVSDATGALEIKNLPVGKHTFTVWLEPRFVSKITGQQIKRGGKWDVEIKAGDNDKGTLKVPVQ